METVMYTKISWLFLRDTLAVQQDNAFKEKEKGDVEIIASKE